MTKEQDGENVEKFAGMIDKELTVPLVLIIILVRSILLQE